MTQDDIDRITCAQATLNALVDHGIDTVFGIPGIHTLDLYRGLAQTPLRHVAVRHEQGAAFMADGFARVAGRPAGCLLITGPGLLNAATAIGQAYSDSVPMIVLATVNDRRDLGLGRGEIHELKDQRRALEGVVDSVITVHDPAEVGTALDLSFARMGAQRPRPAVVELPLDVAAAEVAPRPAAGSAIARPGLSPGSLQALVGRLRAAERPFFILGGGALGAQDELRALVQKLAAPVVTTVAGKGIVSEAGPLALGSALGSEVVNPVMNAADLVVAVGTELAYLDHFNRPLEIRPDLVRIDLDPDVLVRDHPASLALLADARTAVAQVLEVMAEDPARPPWRDDVAALREGLRGEMRERRPAFCAHLDALRESLDDEAAIFTDMTQLAYTGNRYFQCRRGGTWLHPVGFGTLGYALPAAIGGKLAAPERQVVALAGDYGLGFTLQELGTAVEQRLALPVVIWNNRLLGAIDFHMRRLEVPPQAVNLQPPNFRDLAKAFGCDYELLDSPDPLGAALDAAFDAAAPTLIEIEVDGSYES
ncbi:MAG: 5-guanidino-2-oxopentanoate decarboxylase [Kiloniellales bacterium]|nr:5-guanidino-2-oxopentanoate decarboxylase [Kiloniellales bacterium]